MIKWNIVIIASLSFEHYITQIVWLSKPPWSNPDRYGYDIMPFNHLAINANLKRCCGKYIIIGTEHSGNRLNQWGTALHRNGVSHWLNANPEWSCNRWSMYTGCLPHWGSQATLIARFMGPTCCRPQMGPMFAPWTLLSGKMFQNLIYWILTS